MSDFKMEITMQTSTIFLVFWMSNAGFWEIDDKKICVQTSFSRIPLRICLQIKVNLENFVDSEKRPQKKAKSEIEILILV